MEEIERQKVEGEKDFKQVENETSIGSFHNKAFEDTEDTSPRNQNRPAKKDDSEDLKNILFVSPTNPFSRISSKGFCPEDLNDEVFRATKSYGTSNVRAPRKKSDSYSPANYQPKTDKKLFKTTPEKGVTFLGTSTSNVLNVYDLQKRMEQQGKKKGKQSSRVRFDLDDDQHPDELEWERQVYSNRNMPDILASAAEQDHWNETDESLGIIFGRSRNESKTDDSPVSSISDGEDCEIWNLDEEHATDGVYPPSDDENMTTYVINPELKRSVQDGMLTEL
jgi:hypothetical protein